MTYDQLKEVLLKSVLDDYILLHIDHREEMRLKLKILNSVFVRFWANDTIDDMVTPGTSMYVNTNFWLSVASRFWSEAIARDISAAVTSRLEKHEDVSWESIIQNSPYMAMAREAVLIMRQNCIGNNADTAFEDDEDGSKMFLIPSNARAYMCPVNLDYNVDEFLMKNNWLVVLYLFFATRTYVWFEEEISKADVKPQ